MDNNATSAQDRLMLYVVLICTLSVLLALLVYKVMSPEPSPNNPVRSIVNEQKLDAREPREKTKEEKLESDIGSDLD